MTKEKKRMQMQLDKEERDKCGYRKKDLNVIRDRGERQMQLQKESKEIQLKEKENTNANAIGERGKRQTNAKE
ncbi:hypothetical protein CHS0354_037159 [Potamilus streckersoni]|uniref:Uncharacterized protein n=1 Tax=Potamilus streckersoni TaxID=2493646 RepID=A0AAE0SXF5_9BIVA|nr:hypothetical protein CHS0354_037159 [Potamilus streckersoni]